MTRDPLHAACPRCAAPAGTPCHYSGTYGARISAAAPGARHTGSHPARMIAAQVAAPVAAPVRTPHAEVRVTPAYRQPAARASAPHSRAASDAAFREAVMLTVSSIMFVGGFVMLLPVLVPFLASILG